MWLELEETTQAIHLHSPGHHLTPSWGQEDIFFWPEKKCHIIHSNWCLMPTLASLGPSRFGHSGWCIVLLSCSNFYPLHARCSFYYLLSEYLFLMPLFFFIPCPFSRPPFLMNCVCIWAWELSEAMAVPSLLSVCWPPILSCYFFCPAIN